MTNELSVGVDLGGTKIEVAVIAPNGDVLSSRRIPTLANRTPDAIISSIATCVQELQTDHQATTLGIGVAGQIETRTGVVHFAPNLRWRQVPLQQELQKATGLPVLVVNDVRAATFGEWAFGAADQSENCIGVFVGTGVGGGIVSGGSLLEGCTNTAGELGHMTILVGGRKCTCPNRGCLEAYAGGWAIAQRAQEAVTSQPEAGRTLVKIAGSVESVTPEVVAQAFHNNDPLAQRIVQDTATYLAAGMVSIVNALNPCVLVLGGGVIKGIPELVSLVQTRVLEHALPETANQVQIRTAVLPPHSGTIGAAALARRMIGQGTKI